MSRFGKLLSRVIAFKTVDWEIIVNRKKKKIDYALLYTLYCPNKLMMKIAMNKKGECYKMFIHDHKSKT